MLGLRLGETLGGGDHHGMLANNLVILRKLDADGQPKQLTPKQLRILAFPPLVLSLQASARAGGSIRKVCELILSVGLLVVP